MERKETPRIGADPMPWDASITFRASGRALVLRSLLFFIVAALLGSFAGLSFGETLIAASILTLGHLAILYWIRIGTYGVRLDARGIRRLDPREETLIEWDEVRALDLGETAARLRGRSVRLRYVVVEGHGGKRILFSDLSTVGSPQIRIDLDGPRPITDVRDSGVLLALIADHIGDERYLPTVLMERPRAVPAESGGGAAELASAGPERQRVSVAGLLAIVAKVGGKIVKGIPVGLKTFKPGLALASGAVFGVIFTWQFAVAIMVMLAFHEYGHVHAMRRAGLQVRGIYFIPLLGAAAVTEDTWRRRTDQARIALNGPLWGLALTAVAVAVDATTGHEYPFAGVVVAWWALVNLFNLLPISPLDGGRILHAIAYSLGSRSGIALSVAMIAAALGLAFLLGIGLLAFVGLIGLLEFATEAAAAVRARRIRSSPRVANLSPAGLATLKGLARPSLGDEADQALFHMELRQATRLRRTAEVAPMTRRQAIRWGAAYLAVTAAFAGLLVVAGATHPDAALAREIAR